MVCKSTTVAPVLLTVAALAFSVRATGQTANLSGMVTDASRAVVVGASISITKESTGLKQVTSSNALGFYRHALVHWTPLRPGTGALR